MTGLGSEDGSPFKGSLLSSINFPIKHFKFVDSKNHIFRFKEEPTMGPQEVRLYRTILNAFSVVKLCSGVI